MAANTRAKHLFNILLLSCNLLAISLAVDPEREHCSQQCQSIQGESQREECRRRCLDLSREREGREKYREEEGRGDEQEKRSPYLYDKKSFKIWGKSRHGHFKVLERFSKRSELLQGIENYRLAILVADPKTFILPSHWDAEEVFYVIGGRGTITLLSEENRESHDVQRGDIMRVPAWMVVYLINKDNKEKLRIAMLLNPINTPGRFKEFFGVGGEDSETFYRSFSTEVLEAALKTPRERIEKLFGQQKGEIIRASDEQIRALSEHSSSTEAWSFWQLGKPFNLLNKSPSHSNDHGELYEANSDDYGQLWDVEVDISIANISSGSMMAPNYNSRATKIALVVEGEGYFEMVCPHLSKQKKRREWEQEHEQEEEEEEQGRGTRYQTVRSKLSMGSVLVIPPGHPVVVVASGGENLQVLCFGIRAENNKKFYLAGRNSQMEREATELSFGWPVKEVEEVFNAQHESVFFSGPQRHQEEGEQSVLSFAGF